MATITLKGEPIHTCGELPKIGEKCPDFTLVRNNLSDITLSEFTGKRKIISIFPSIETKVCSSSVRTFNRRARELGNTVILNISYDLPFAFQRFCEAEDINQVETLSCFRSNFAKDFGVQIIDGPFRGLCSRAIITLDVNNIIIHTQQVPEIGSEPNYDDIIFTLEENIR